MAKKNQIAMTSLEDARQLDIILNLIETEPRKAKQELKKLFQKIIREENDEVAPESEYSVSDASLSDQNRKENTPAPPLVKINQSPQAP